MLKGLERYEEEYDVDASTVLCEDHLSDDASGPEDANEDKETWKERMLVHLGIDIQKMDKKTMDELIVWENVEPDWRSEEVSCCFNVLSLTYLHPLHISAYRNPPRARSFLV